MAILYRLQYGYSVFDWTGRVYCITYDYIPSDGELLREGGQKINELMKLSTARHYREIWWHCDCNSAAPPGQSSRSTKIYQKKMFLRSSGPTSLQCWLQMFYVSAAHASTTHHSTDLKRCNLHDLLRTISYRRWQLLLEMRPIKVKHTYSLHTHKS